MYDEKIDQKINEIEDQLYKKLKSNGFVFVLPESLDGDFLPKVQEIEKHIQKSLKDPQIKKLMNEYIDTVKNPVFNYPPPALLEFEKNNLDLVVYNFLYAQHRVQQYRWHLSLPEFSIYSLEFFLPEMTEENKVKLQIERESETQLKETVTIDMPYELIIDEKGFFDMQATKEFEAKYHLIASRIATYSILESIGGYYYNELINFPSWAFFAINHEKEIKEIGFQILQVIYDSMYLFTIDQIFKGIPVDEARKNSLDFLKRQAKDKKLEELLIYRADEIIPLDIFILDILTQLRYARDYLKPETLKDFYSHILQKLSKMILEGKITPRDPYYITIREADRLEKLAVNNEYTVTVNPIDEIGNVLDTITEYYQVKLSTESTTDLIIMATHGLKPGLMIV